MGLEERLNLGAWGRVMSVQQKFQIVSAGKVLRSRNPEEVLAKMSDAFSISAQQARRLFLKGWVIKDELSSGQVVQYRTQLHQMGLKIEVHPAGKFDNRAILARMQFAQKRKARKDAGKSISTSEISGAVGNSEKSSNTAAQAPSSNAKPDVPAKQQPVTKKPAIDVAVSEKKNPKAAQGGGDTSRSVAAAEKATSTARTQLEALFHPDPSARFESASDRLALITGLVGALVVPALFIGLLCLCLVYAGLALWAVPASILAGTASVAAAVTGAAVKLLLVSFLAALFLYPYFTASRARASSNAAGIRLRKPEAPGLFLLLEVLEAKTGLSIAAKLAGPKTLAATSQARGTLVEVNQGADVVVVRAPDGQCTLSVGLGAIASLNGGELLALIARALSYQQGPLVRAASYCSVTTAQNLQSMQEALEAERTLFSSGAVSVSRVEQLLKPLHKILSACGQTLVPVVERLQGLHRATSGSLARRLEARADAAAALMIGSDRFAQFAERWNQLVHADLVCGEINREAQLTGRRLANVPQGIRWLFQNLDEPTRASIELAMSEDTDCWSPLEPAGHDRVAAVEDRSLPAVLQRTEFSVQKLFGDFDDLCTKSSRTGADDSCRPVENQLLLTASKETEEAQLVLSTYFNRAVPRGFLPLHGPGNAELEALGLQECIDWIRSRLIELQELEQRLAQLQLQGARVQLGAALVRAGVRVDPRSYDLCGTTPSDAEASRKDIRVRVEECMLQRQQLHSMFFQRTQRALESMAAADHSAANDALQQLKRFERLREPLGTLDGCGDLLCEMIERLPSVEFPSALTQKYAQLAVRQIHAVYEGAKEQSGLLSQGAMEKLEAYGAGEVEIPSSSKAGDLVGVLQGLELRCKNASAVVHEGYQSALAKLLAVCLEEEARQKVKPLRLVGAL